MLKAAVLDGAQQLRLEQKVLEARRVDAHIALLGLVAALGRALLAGGDLLLLVVEQLLLGVLGDRGHRDVLGCVVRGAVGVWVARCVGLTSSGGRRVGVCVCGLGKAPRAR